MLKAFYYLMLRDMRLALRSRHELANPLIFFVLVTTLFPLAVMPTPERLQEMAPGVIWVAALLSVLLSLDRLFKQDYEDGSLDQLMLSPNPLVILVLAKVCAHWLLTGLPLVIIAPLLGVLMALPAESLQVLIWSLLLGTPVLSLIGAIGVSLTTVVDLVGITSDPHNPGEYLFAVGSSNSIIEGVVFSTANLGAVGIAQHRRRPLDLEQ